MNEQLVLIIERTLATMLLMKSNFALVCMGVTQSVLTMAV